MQRWIELQGAEKDTFAVVEYLASERIRLATLLCRNLAHEMRTTGVKLPEKQCRELLTAVEELFTQLAGFDFVVHDEASETGHATKAKAAKTSNTGVSEPQS